MDRWGEKKERRDASNQNNLSHIIIPEKPMIAR